MTAECSYRIFETKITDLSENNVVSRFSQISRESSVSRMDAESKSSVKFGRRSSFKNMMDRMRRYKSTESIGVNRSQNRTPVLHAPFQTEEPGRIVVPVMVKIQQPMEVNEISNDSVIFVGFAESWKFLLH